MSPPAPEPEPGRGERDPDLYIHAGGRCRSWRGLARVCGAEALGAALLVLASAAPPPTAPHLAPLQAGLTVAMLVQCFGDISGAQLNPCVTLAALLCGRMQPARALGETLAQFCGATAGAAALALYRGPTAALTLPAPHASLYMALCVEALCGACLVLANCAQWERVARGGGGGGDSWPLRIGATVAALATAATPVSGGGMNPARSFGPALLALHWRHHWIYWAGPLSGAGAAAALHCAAWRAPRPRTPPDPRYTSAPAAPAAGSAPQERCKP